MLWIMGLGLIILFKGLYILLAPEGIKKLARKYSEISDGKMKIIGLVTMVIGILLYFLGLVAHYGYYGPGCLKFW